jgi:2-methylcitrate dehydratase PrpD
VRALAAKVSYVIDPADEYPRNFTGHVRARLSDGTEREMRQPHMRGGAREPLGDADILAKYRDNCRFGGWSARRAQDVLAAIERIAAGGAVDLRVARG